MKMSVKVYRNLTSDEIDHVISNNLLPFNPKDGEHAVVGDKSYKSFHGTWKILEEQEEPKVISYDDFDELRIETNHNVISNIASNLDNGYVQWRHGEISYTKTGDHHKQQQDTFPRNGYIVKILENGLLAEQEIFRFTVITQMTDRKRMVLDGIIFDSTAITSFSIVKSVHKTGRSDFDYMGLEVFVKINGTNRTFATTHDMLKRFPPDVSLVELLSDLYEDSRLHKHLIFLIMKELAPHGY